MAEITGKDRIRACMKRTIADRIPVGIIMGPFTAKVFGCSLKDYLTDSKKLAEATIASYELFQQDSVSISMDIFKEAEAVGTELEFFEDSVPRVKRHILAQKSALSSLKLPRPESSGRYPIYIEACQAAAKILKDCAFSGTVTGPWTIGANLRGAQELIFDSMDDPGFVEELMKFTTEVTKILGAGILAAGVSLGMGEAASSCSLISPAIYRRFIKPYHQEIVRFFREKKASLSMHVCGFIDPIMADLMDLGLVALSLDSPSSLQKMVEISQKKIVLVGNVATSLFVNGTRDEMETAVKECIRLAAPGGAYILSSGCELPYNASPDMAKCFIRAAKEYGKAERIGS